MRTVILAFAAVAITPLAHGFVYAHGRTTQIGTFPIGDTVHVGISRSGKHLILSDIAEASQTFRSFIVTCSGTGC